jgi:hypothetical protein
VRAPRVWIVGLLALAASHAVRGDDPSLPLSLSSCSVLAARSGEVRTLYWQLYDVTEVCVNVAPEPGSEGPSPLAFTFSFTHAGREAKAAPSRMVWRVQLPPSHVATSPSLRMVLDEAEPVDLTAPGQPSRLVFSPGCSGGTDCGYIGVEVFPARGVLARMLAAKTISGEALGGVPFSFGAEAKVALYALVQRFDGGERR